MTDQSTAVALIFCSAAITYIAPAIARNIASKNYSVRLILEDWLLCAGIGALALAMFSMIAKVAGMA